MASQTKYPGNGAQVQDGGGREWSAGSLSSICADDGSYATPSSAIGNDHTYTLYGYNFGFTIPVGVVITGITAELETIIPYYDGAGDIADYYVQLTKVAGTRIGNNKAAATWNKDGSWHVQTYGGVGDTWGVGFSGTEINDSGFGLAVQVSVGNVSANIGIDYFKLTVYYEKPSYRALLGVGR